jgi:hypothetical protein
VPYEDGDGVCAATPEFGVDVIERALTPTSGARVEVP